MLLTEIEDGIYADKAGSKYRVIQVESEEIKQARKEKYESVYIDHALADHLLLEAYRNGACSRSLC